MAELEKFNVDIELRLNSIRLEWQDLARLLPGDTRPSAHRTAIDVYIKDLLGILMRRDTLKAQRSPKREAASRSDWRSPEGRADCHW